MRKNIEVAVLPWVGDDAGDGRANGDRATFELRPRYESAQQDEAYAKLCARPFRLKGLAVVIRPLYNDGQAGYHEFRSFNGGPWYRCNFGPGGSSSIKEAE